MAGLTLKDVLHDVVIESPIPPKQLAEELGISYSMLLNCANPEIPRANLRAQKIVPLTKLTGDTRLLDFMEAAVGRVAFSVPELPKNLRKVELMVADNVREFGEVLEQIGKALDDGEIDPIEFKRIEREVIEQVNAAMGLLEACRRMVG